MSRIVLLFLTMVLATAQSQNMQYLQEQLTVEVEKTIIASYQDWDAFLSASMRIGGGGLEIRESKKWDCYRGGIKISEAGFYETAGLNEYARKAQSYKGDRDLLVYGGLLVSAVGLGMWLYDYANSVGYYERDPNALTWIGLGVYAVGLVDLHVDSICDM